jgi:hypothetical protein
MAEVYSFDDFTRRPKTARPAVAPRAHLAPGAAPSRYAQGALAREEDALRATTQGGRNDRLNVAAFSLGQLVAGGEISRELVEQVLTDAALFSGLEPVETANTLKSGLDKGAQTPRTAPPPTQAASVPLVIDVAREDLLRIVTEAGDDDTEPEPTSWLARPIIEAAADDATQPVPAFLARTDGACLLYPGRINTLLGESESGKSWLALLAVVQAVRAGHRVLVLDFEDSAGSVKGRLAAMGLSPDELTLVDYALPVEALTSPAALDLSRSLANNPALIVVDGVNAAMSLMGYDLISNNDATLFAQRLLRPMAATGAAVVTVDHVPKDTEKRGKGGIGAQAKRAMIDGCAITVEVVEPFGKGQAGELKLTVDKDRPGVVRGLAAGSKVAGRAHLVSIGDTVTLTVVPPSGVPDAAGQVAEFHPTAVMERASDLLQRNPNGLSGRDVRDALKGRRDIVAQALVTLAQAGYVNTSTGHNRSTIHRSVRPYKEGDPLSVPVFPGVPASVPGERDKSVFPDPLPPTGRGTPDGITGDKSEAPKSGNTETAIPEGYGHCNDCGRLNLEWALAEGRGFCDVCAHRRGER